MGNFNQKLFEMREKIKNLGELRNWKQFYHLDTKMKKLS